MAATFHYPTDDRGSILNLSWFISVIGIGTWLV
jgi:hypothetical protein